MKNSEAISAVFAICVRVFERMEKEKEAVLEDGLFSYITEDLLQSEKNL